MSCQSQLPVLTAELTSEYLTNDVNILKTYEEEIVSLETKKKGIESLIEKYLMLESSERYCQQRTLKSDTVKFLKKRLQSEECIPIDNISVQRSVIDLLSVREQHLKEQLLQSRHSTNSSNSETLVELRKSENLSNMKVMSCTLTQLIVEFSPPRRLSKLTLDVTDPALPAVSSPLQLTINFTVSADGRQTIANAKVNVAVMDISDLIQNARKTNDEQLFLLSVYKRWEKYWSLLTEIEPLRHQYALDWIYSEGIIRVLYGSQATCTLKLNDNYPAICSVTLVATTGLPADITFDNLQVPSDSTLRLALAFLQDKLVPVATVDMQ